jgi:serine/threonine protein kinase
VHFPQLEILELLGHGGMGAVYKARQPKLDRLVALKIIRPEAAGDPAFAERFNREARLLARLSHPHIVAVYDFGEVSLSAAGAGTNDQQLYFFLMEYVDGMNLRQLLQTGELLPEQALAIVPQICEALQFAHDEGIVHRDIKPENILLDKRGRVKIADFGLAKLAASSPQEFTLTGTHQVMGTPRYMAPEQMEGSRAVDHRADIYSLGVVFYEMLTGEVPMGHFDPPSQKVKVDVRLDEVVLRALAREPQRRYQRVSEVKTDVESISHTSPPPQAIHPVRETPADDAFVDRVFERMRLENAAVDALSSRVRLPAILLLIIGVVSCSGWWVDVIIPEPGASTKEIPEWAEFLVYVITIVLVMAWYALCLTMIIGAVKMLRLTSYRWAMAASIVALSPIPSGPLWLLSLPLGIWLLLLLRTDDVKRKFYPRKVPAQRNSVHGDQPDRRYQHASNATSEVESISQTSWRAPTPEMRREVQVDDAENKAARQQIQFPVIGLLVCGILTLPPASRAVLSRYGDKLFSEAPEQILFWLAFFGPPLVTITGAVKMLRLASFRWAVAAGLLVFISPAVLEYRQLWWFWSLCLLVGIWSLVVLAKPEVKRAFASGAKTTVPLEPGAARRVQNPAWGLIITGIVSWITIPLAFMIPFMQPDLIGARRTIFQISFGVIPLVVGTIMALAGFRMKRLESYRLAMFAAVLPNAVLLFKLVGLSFGTLAIGPADLVGAPVGLWVLVILTRSDVQAAFHAKESRNVS